jgi:hypothetical protein
MVLLLCLVLALASFAGWAWLDLSGALSVTLLIVSIGAIALEGARRRKKAGKDPSRGSDGSAAPAKYRIVGLGIVLHDDPPRNRR